MAKYLRTSTCPSPPLHCLYQSAHLDQSVHGCGLGTPHQTLYLSSTEVPGPLSEVSQVHVLGQLVVLDHLSSVDVEDLLSAILIRKTLSWV